VKLIHRFFCDIYTRKNDFIFYLFINLRHVKFLQEKRGTCLGKETCSENRGIQKKLSKKPGGPFAVFGENSPENSFRTGA
jgi:hypothetical protein